MMIHNIYKLVLDFTDTCTLAKRLCAVYSSVGDTKFLQDNNRNLQINGIAAARALLVVTAGRTIYGLAPRLSLALITEALA